MVNPSPSWNTVPVYGTYRNPSTGLPVKGYLTFTFPYRIVSATDEVIFPAGTVRRVDLNQLGQVQVDFPAVDDPDVYPNNWWVDVVEVFDPGDGKGLTYQIQPTLGMLPTGLNLRGVLPSVTPGTGPSYTNIDLSVATGRLSPAQSPVGGALYVDFTATARPTVPAGTKLFIIGGTAAQKPAWAQPGDFYMAAGG